MCSGTGIINSNLQDNKGKMGMGQGLEESGLALSPHRDKMIDVSIYMIFWLNTVFFHNIGFTVAIFSSPPTWSFMCVQCVI